MQAAQAALQDAQVAQMALLAVLQAVNAAAVALQLPEPHPAAQQVKDRQQQELAWSLQRSPARAASAAIRVDASDLRHSTACEKNSGVNPWLRFCA